MTYPEFFVAPMRQELTSLGVKELKTAAEVDAVLGRQQPGEVGPGSPKLGEGGPTVMVIVNSVCGCAAGKARPGIALALRHQTRPDIVSTVFAGADVEATDRARGYFTGYPPSSPSIALLRDGKLLWMLERRNIENQTAEMIAKNLTDAFDKYCAPATVRT
jgi:putative YphP/YqiW family bacilliredoxin